MISGEYMRQWRQKNKEKISKINKRYMFKLRKKIIYFYSKGQNCCQCIGCTEDNFEFLAIDHINNNGAEHRRKIGNGTIFYRWLINNNFPDGFTVLCHSCNMARSFPRNNSICPHEQMINKITGLITI